MKVHAANGAISCVHMHASRSVGRPRRRAQRVRPPRSRIDSLGHLAASHRAHELAFLPTSTKMSRSLRGLLSVSRVRADEEADALLSAMVPRILDGCYPQIPVWRCGPMGPMSC